MVLDECPAGDLDHAAVVSPLAMTLRWAKRSLDARQQALDFCNYPGGVYRDCVLNQRKSWRQLPFDGMAIGGLSVGEPKPAMYEVLSYHPQQLPEDKIRYLMGVGTPGGYRRSCARRGRSFRLCDSHPRRPLWPGVYPGRYSLSEYSECRTSALTLTRSTTAAAVSMPQLFAGLYPSSF